MATNVFDHLLSSDVYSIADIVNETKKKYIDEDDQTLSTGIFGYIGSVETAKIQMAIQMASELSNEVFPNRAKYDRNVITHATMYDIYDIHATPAELTAVIFIKKKDIEANSKDDMFVLDKNIPIYIDDGDGDTGNTYEFHLYYDVILTKVTINWDEEVYTARYDTTIKNPLSSIQNPYLNAPVSFIYGGEQYIGVQVKLYQVSLAEEYHKIITSSLIDNKTFIFTHEDQIASFTVEVTENDVTTVLTPVYEGGTVPSKVTNFCYYMMLDDEKVRVKFERTSYMPKINADITVKIQTTKGYKGNFKYKAGYVFATLTSSNYNYSNLQSMVRIQTDSANGLDYKSADELRKIIPKEALSRGSITTSDDLNNYFNQLNTDDDKILLPKKVDNQVERTYYTHLLIKDEEGNVVPTNTIKLAAKISDFPITGVERYVIPAGAIIGLDAETDYGYLVYTDIYEQYLENLAKEPEYHPDKPTEPENPDPDTPVNPEKPTDPDPTPKPEPDIGTETLSGDGYPDDWPYDKLYEVDSEGVSYAVADPGHITVSTQDEVIPVADEDLKCGVTSVVYGLKTGDIGEATDTSASTFSMRSLPEVTVEDSDTEIDDPELAAINAAAKAGIEQIKSTDYVNPEAETRLEEGVEDYTLTQESVDEENPPVQEEFGDNYDAIVLTGTADITGTGGAGTTAVFTKDDSLVEDPTYKVVDNLSYVKPVYDANVINFMYLVTDEEEFKVDSNNRKMFYYTNPYTIVINAGDELYAAYYLCLIDETRIINYKFINQDSDVQFICDYVHWYRKFITDNNTYKMDFTIAQNIQRDLGLYVESDVTIDGDVQTVMTDLKVRVFVVMYRNGAPYRYKEGKFVSFDDTDYSFDFQVSMKTNNIILDTDNNIRIEDLGLCNQEGTDYGYFPANTETYLYVLVRDGGAAGRGDIDGVIPGLEGYSVTNKFEINEGVDFFVNYSGVMSSKVDVVDKTETMDQSYVIASLPVVGYQYALNEDLMDSFVGQLNYKKAYIDNANEKIENTFGVDFKFYNTYGPSKLFTLDTDKYYIDRVNVQLNFRLKLSNQYDSYTADYVKAYVKETIENLNGSDSLHIPNLITDVTNKFRSSITFFEFLGIDGYGPGVQHLYHKDVDYVEMVPEFININMLYNEDGTKTPDINIEIV